MASTRLNTWARAEVPAQATNINISQVDLQVSLNHLGFLIESNDYVKKDWDWLLLIS